MFLTFAVGLWVAPSSVPGDAMVDLVAILPWWMDFLVGHFLPGVVALVE